MGAVSSQVSPATQDPSSTLLAIRQPRNTGAASIDFASIAKYTVDGSLDESAYFVKIGTLMMSGRGSWLLVLVCKRRIAPEDLVSVIRAANPRFREAFPNALVYDPLFSGMISLRAPSAPSVLSPLSSLTPGEALAVGKSLSDCLKSSKTADHGLLLWQERCPAVSSLFLTDPRFVSLSTAVARRKLMLAPWGMALRVGLGAFLSVLDMVTDLLTINLFCRQRQFGFAAASAAMIGTAMLLQVFIVYGQGRKRGSARVCREILIVFSTLKPAVDAYRVVRGREHSSEEDEDNTVDAMMEMMGSKVIEM